MASLISILLNYLKQYFHRPSRKKIMVTFSLGIMSFYFTTLFLFGYENNTVLTRPLFRNFSKKISFAPKWWEARYPFLQEANQYCPQCLFVDNESEWETSDAVVFHGRMLRSKIPTYRPSGQIWVFMNFETVADRTDESNYVNAKYYDGMFNWTLTYRRDSDIFVPYGRFVSILEKPRPSIMSSWAFMPGALGQNTYGQDSYLETPSPEEISKRKMVAWITSRCKSPSKREVIARELSKYIQVDIYGNCGELKCKVPKSKARTGIDCRVQIAKDYKFYLAFENSICEDYVTEKFFDTALTQMVPIVYGGSDYSKIFPEKSFINVADFESVKKLAEYLLYLDGNVMEYLKYFEWRKSYWVQTNRFVTGYCDLCEKLLSVSKSHTHKTYTSVLKWWVQGKDSLENHNSLCSNPEEKFPYLFSNLSSTS